MATTPSYGLNLNNIMRAIRQRKAAGGYVPKSFIDNILEANINTAANRAMDQEKITTQKEQFEKSLAQNKEQYEKSLAEQVRGGDLNRALTEEQISNQGTSAMASTLVQAPLNIWAMSKMYDKLFQKTPATTPMSVAGPNPAMQQPQIPGEATGRAPWLDNEQIPVDNTLAPEAQANTFMPEMIEAGTPAAADTIVGTTFSGPNLGAMPATQAPQVVGGGTAAGTTAGTTAGAKGSALSGYMAPLLYIMAAEKVRQRSQPDKAYEDRGAWEKMGSAPVTGGPAALVEGIAPGSSGNALVKPLTAVAKAEEQLVGEPLDKFFEGDIGGGIGATVGGIVEAPKTFLNTITGGGCIIITACTRPHAYEVEIAREYRDSRMDADQLRGYYMIAEKVVPLLNCDLKKKFVKGWFVDPLVDYGEVMLGKKPGPCRVFSYLVARFFLTLCRKVGQTRKSFVRANGEVF
ncbi:MAG: hypothetical protein WC455_17345 [Dehalococcoidia bacterium]|jgi:hypothetical protein